MVSLDNAVIARFQRGEDHFEILVDPNIAAQIIEGKDEDVASALAIDSVFTDAKKGTHASEESLTTVFQTTNINSIAKTIILKGEIQLTTEQRHEMQEKKKNRVIDKIVKNAMDPQTKTPHPRQRIERAMEEAGVHIDPIKPVAQQVKLVVDAIRPILPISMDQIKISVRIPAEHIGKAYGVARHYGSLEREDWQSDGSWIGVIRLPAGMQTDFYDKLNEVTKGNVDTRILK